MLVNVICPVYNEINNIKFVLEKLSNLHVKGFHFRIIIVESNSSDGSREIIKNFENKNLKRKLNFTYIYQKKARGKGNAVREALELIKKESLILIQDSDLEYDFNDYHKLLVPFLKDPNLMLVIGNRNKFRKFGNFGLRSLYMNIGQLFFHKFFQLLYCNDIKDPTSMFKIFRMQAINNLVFNSNRFDFDWELICKLARLKVKYAQFEVNYSSRGFAEGKKVGLFLEPIVWIFKILKYRFIKIK